MSCKGLVSLGPCKLRYWHALYQMDPRRNAKRRASARSPGSRRGITVFTKEWRSIWAVQSRHPELPDTLPALWRQTQGHRLGRWMKKWWNSSCRRLSCRDTGPTWWGFCRWIDQQATFASPAPPREDPSVTDKTAIVLLCPVCKQEIDSETGI